MESGGGRGAYGAGNWERVSDVEARLREPREVDLSELEMDYSK